MDNPHMGMAAARDVRSTCAQQRLDGMLAAAMNRSRCSRFCNPTGEENEQRLTTATRTQMQVTLNPVAS